MSIESVESLIDWTRNLHFRLAKALAAAQRSQQDERASELLGYLQQHENRLGELVTGFEKRADPKALNTMVQDYETHSPIDIDQLCNKPFGAMSYDEIATEVLATHNHMLELYDFLISRAPIPEEVELLEKLLTMQRHETQLISHQVNRGRDL